jgi:CelD/BcsL family acetyltransferase involved in cellulose biosynthesis
MASRGSHPFDSFRPGDWDAAAGARRTPMQHHIWASAYAETLARGEVEVFIAGDAAAPDALAPFARSVSGSGRWTLLGAEDIWESVEVSAKSVNAEEALSRVIARAGRPFRFGHYPSDSVFANALGTNAQGLATLVKRPFAGRAMPRIALDTDWNEPESKLSSRRRSDLKRMARIASEFGATTFEIVSPGPGTVDALVDEAFDVEVRNWKGRAGTAIANSEPISKFYRAYARRAAAAGILRLCFLRIGGAAAAMQIAVECDRTFWLLKIGYVDDFKRCSPGNLLMRHAIAYAARQKLAAFEFLGKESEWTRLWTDEARPISTLRLYSFTVSGATVFARDAAEQIQKGLQRKLVHDTARTAAEPA